MDAGSEGVEYRVGENVIDENYVLGNGDVINAYDSYGNIIGYTDIPEPAPKPVTQTIMQTAAKAEEEEEAPAEVPTIQEPVSPNAIPFNGRGGINVELNGEHITLAPRNGDYILLDLLNSINIDPAVPNSEIILEINGAPANFSSYISDGDRAVIKVQERTGS